MTPPVAWTAESGGPVSPFGELPPAARELPAGTSLASPFREAPALAVEHEAGFDQFIGLIDELEQLAIADGYRLVQRITALRKVFYGAFNPCGKPVTPGSNPYPGTTGGGAWDILIPGAAATDLPPSWRQPANAEKVTTLCRSSRQVVNARQLNAGHVFAGLDARNHPTAVSIKIVGVPVVRMRSNLEATTFTGDLGSVVVEYLKGSKRSFRDTAMELDSASLTATYNWFADDGDMAGNADAHVLAVDPASSVAQNLHSYYAPQGSWRHRWKGFTQAIGLGSFTPVPKIMVEPYRSLIVGIFSGHNNTWHSTMQGEIMQAALAYAGGKGHRGDVFNVLTDPGPGIVVPTFWEMYWNAAGWVLDEFLLRLKRAVAAEP